MRRLQVEKFVDEAGVRTGRVAPAQRELWVTALVNREAQVADLVQLPENAIPVKEVGWDGEVLPPGTRLALLTRDPTDDRYALHGLDLRLAQLCWEDIRRGWPHGDELVALIRHRLSAGEEESAAQRDAKILVAAEVLGLDHDEAWGVVGKEESGAQGSLIKEAAELLRRSLRESGPSTVIVDADGAVLDRRLGHIPAFTDKASESAPSLKGAVAEKDAWWRIIVLRHRAELRATGTIETAALGELVAKRDAVAKKRRRSENRLAGLLNKETDAADMLRKSAHWKIESYTRDERRLDDAIAWLRGEGSGIHARPAVFPLNRQGRLLSVMDVSRILGVGTMRVYGLVAAGDLQPATSRSAALRFSPEAIEELAHASASGPF